MSLQRFHRAQANREDGFIQALDEIRSGRKVSHWIWYIFPQLAGLGRSSTAEYYGIRNVEEACAYLADPVLRERYEAIVDAVDTQLSAGGLVEDLMGGDTDARKLASSLTLFRAAARRLGHGEAGADFARLASRWDAILQRLSEQGFGPCAFTLEQFGGPFPG